MRANKGVIETDLASAAILVGYGGVQKSNKKLGTRRFLMLKIDKKIWQGTEDDRCILHFSSWGKSGRWSRNR
jgi:hypothetical protein